MFARMGACTTVGSRCATVNACRAGAPQLANPLSGGKEAKLRSGDGGRGMAGVVSRRFETGLLLLFASGLLAVPTRALK
jgi:hypothetical protein